MADSKTLEQRCHFETERLLVESWKLMTTCSSSEGDFACKVIGIMTQEVTKSLPEGWQEIDTTEKALDWVKARAEEGSFLTVQLRSTKKIVGFVFLHELANPESGFIDLKIGYLLSEAAWGKGFGSELIHGLMSWCEGSGDIASVSGGVDKDNIASIKVLEKNGFKKITSVDPPTDVVFLERVLRH